jgi:hypothetical protein
LIKKKVLTEGVDALGSLLDLTTDRLGDELLDELLEVRALSLAAHDLGHLGADLTELRRLSVGGLLDLVAVALGEADSEEAEDVTVSGLDVNRGLNERLPLADERAELVGGEVHAVERGQAVLARNILNAELDLAERLLLVVVEVGERELKDTALERVVGVLETLGAVDKSLAGVAVLKERRGLDVVPVYGCQLRVSWLFQSGRSMPSDLSRTPP